MAIFKTGDMWDVFKKVDYFLFTGNNVIRKDGSLVMGAGIALEVKTRIPKIDNHFGRHIKAHSDDVGFYGLILSPVYKIGVFQTKNHFKDKASLSLIERSSEALRVQALISNKTFALAFPGIGYGGRSIEEVLPIVSKLPDNVQIWTRS
jgi:hypothetical protein